MDIKKIVPYFNSSFRHLSWGTQEVTKNWWI